MPEQELDLMVSKIQEDDSATFEITPRMLLNSLGCQKRTSNNMRIVDTFLSSHQLEVTPDYSNGWIDGKITLRHKKRATSKVGKDPIRKLAVLEAANQVPMTINNDAPLQEAVTKMIYFDYSQLPVTTGRTPIGFISWKSIGSAIANGNESKLVKDYVNKNLKILPLDTPLLSAVEVIYKNDFIVVQKPDRTLCGIVTTADLSSQFLLVTEPFLLLEQIEKHIRRILDGKFLVEELAQFKNQDDKRTIECIDDLTFGEYLILMQTEDNWKKLELCIDRSYFLQNLEDIRQIRNDVMHFSPEGIDDDQRNKLLRMAEFLAKIYKC
jgi:predicted transcriptional regulator